MSNTLTPRKDGDYVKMEKKTMEFKTKEEEIKHLEGAIKSMKADEEVFGLVREDRDKILKWRLRIRELQKS